MGCRSLSIALVSHNEDLRRLLDKGYALRIDGAHLVVRDIPYLDHNLDLKIGAMIAKLVPVDKVKVVQDNHQIYFAGSTPYGLDGRPIPNMGEGGHNIVLTKKDVVVERSFSNKPPAGFPDFFAKIEHYVHVICGPAIAKYPEANPLTFNVDNDVIGETVFKFHDSLTSLAEIGDLAIKFKDEVVAIIGLGGTGSYTLDYIVKTPVKEIRGFDGDVYHVHNAYRSPGELTEADLGKAKAEVLQRRYENFRHGLKLTQKYIDSTSAPDLAGVTFAFVCVDKGTARKEIFELLIALGIPFIDVGIGLNRKQDLLAGTIRTSYYGGAGTAAARYAENLAETTDDPNDIYRRNVQIAELNALNAAVAVLRYKQIVGFYLDDGSPYHMLMRTHDLKLLRHGGSE